ncbi:hypothetical protein H5U35_10595, partial [Candidatus Aerophobetes bacterium]|nr:hypothetical protein [Candidatus Aerophobetes bacterium]
KHMANLGINISPLWWSLAVGVALGGNGTPIGSSAGVVVMELTEKTKHPLTFKKWFIYATLPAICTTGVASLAMILEGIFFS